MPVFEYKGYGPNGKNASGVVDAQTARIARAKLRKDGILATSVKTCAGGGEIRKEPLKLVFNRISARDISYFTRRLATLQSAGLTLVESLDALVEQADNPRFAKVITGVREQVLGGSSLADAMSGYPSCFDDMYVNLTRAGEASGALGQTLEKMAEFSERRLRRGSRISAAMIYPAVMTVVGSGALMFLMTYVVPQMQTMFDDMEQALPLPTVILLAVAGFLHRWWLALIAFAVAVGAALSRYSRTKKGRRLFDGMVLKLPVLGAVLRSAGIARFTGALGVLLGGGAPLVESLRISGKTVGNVIIAEAVENAAASVTEGKTLAEPLRRSGLFPPVVTQMISAGERSGSLENMLGKITDAYDFEVETALTALTSLVETLLILVMGAVVLFIVLAILTPIFEISHIAG